MVLIKRNYLKSDIFFNPIFIPGFSGSRIRVQVIEELKLSIDNAGFAGEVLMDLHKALDTINHQLLLVELHAYGFSQQVLAIICSYLSNRKQRIK